VGEVRLAEHRVGEEDRLLGTGCKGDGHVAGGVARGGDDPDSGRHLLLALDKIQQARLADRDQAIGEVIQNLNTVLDTTVKHQKQFDDTLKNFELLITGLKNRADPIASSVADISDAAGTVGDLLADIRPLLKDTVGYLEGVQQPLIDQSAQVNDLLIKIPEALKIIGRAGGVYGDFFNFYVCDITLKLNGLQPGGPVRSVRLTSQPSGRCTPK